VGQEGLWTPTAALPVSASHSFHERLNQILDEQKFGEYVETICEEFYAGECCRPALLTGNFFPAADGGLFRRDRFGARNRIASVVSNK